MNSFIAYAIILSLVLPSPSSFAEPPEKVAPATAAPLDLEKGCSAVLDSAQKKLDPKTLLDDLHLSREFGSESQRYAFDQRTLSSLRQNPHASDAARIDVEGRRNYPALFKMLKAGYEIHFPKVEETIVHLRSASEFEHVKNMRKRFIQNCQEATLRSRGYRLDRVNGETSRVEVGNGSVRRTKLSEKDLGRIRPDILRRFNDLEKANGKRDFTFEIEAVSDPRDEEADMRIQLRDFFRDPAVARYEGVYRTVFQDARVDSDQPLLTYPPISSCLRWDAHKTPDMALSTHILDPKSADAYESFETGLSSESREKSVKAFTEALEARKKDIREMDEKLKEGSVPSPKVAAEFEELLNNSLKYAPDTFYSLLHSTDQKVRVGLCSAYRNVKNAEDLKRWHTTELEIASAVALLASGGIAAFAAVTDVTVWIAVGTEWLAFGIAGVSAITLAGEAKEAYENLETIEDNQLLSVLTLKKYQKEKLALETHLAMSSFSTLMAVLGYYGQATGVVERSARFEEMVREFPALGKKALWKVAYILDEKAAPRLDALYEAFLKDGNAEVMNDALNAALRRNLKDAFKLPATLAEFNQRAAKTAADAKNGEHLKELWALIARDLSAKRAGTADEATLARLDASVDLIKTITLSTVRKVARSPRFAAMVSFVLSEQSEAKAEKGRTRTAVPARKSGGAVPNLKD